MFARFCERANASPWIRLVVFSLTVLAAGCAQMKVNQTIDRLNHIETGQSSKEVIYLLGPPVIEEEISDRRYVTFYQTRRGHSSDSAVTVSLCTPVVFENNQVAGIGLDVYQQWLREERERRRNLEIEENRRRKEKMTQLLQQQKMEEKQKK